MTRVLQEFSGELPAALARPHFLQVVADGRVTALWPLLPSWELDGFEAAWVIGLGWLVSLIPEVEGRRVTRPLARWCSDAQYAISVQDRMGPAEMSLVQSFVGSRLDSIGRHRGCSRHWETCRIESVHSS